MIFFTIDEYREKYNSTDNIEEWQIEAVCEMIFSQISQTRRDSRWDISTVPFDIKRASMEQLRFMLEYDIPFIDYDKKVKVGSMEAELKSDYSTLALRILANNGYLYRGNMGNIGLNITMGC